MKEFKQIILKDMKRSFGGLNVLDSFNLTINKGEFITFLGPSGCGKSTALNCITGLMRISDGQILVDDEVIDNSKNVYVAPEKRGFGIVFQNYALFPHMNIFKNVAFSLEIKKLPKKEIEERVNEALKIVHLEGYGEKFPTQLSGGQQQRVAIARCIVMEPRLLLLDEPLSNLDAKLRVEMRYELKMLHERLGISTVYVTHDQEEALALSDRIVVLKIGKIQQIGTPQEIFRNPANQFVADFMGYKNMWPARVKRIRETNGAHEITIDVKGLELKSYRNYAGNEANLKKISEAYKNNKDVVTAIRPEDFIIGGVETNVVNCIVDLIEYLGTTFQVDAHSSKGLDVVARHEGLLKIGQQVSYHIPPEKLIIFSPEV